MVFWLLLPVYSGSLKRIDYPKQICLVHRLSFECLTALTGTQILFGVVLRWFGVFPGTASEHAESKTPK